MTDSIRLRGTATDFNVGDEAKRDEDLAATDGLKIEYRAAVDLTPRDRGEGEELELEVEDSDVVESQDGHGYVEFTSVRSLRARTAAQRGGPAGGPIDLLAALGVDPGTRGKRALQRVRVYGVEFPTDIREYLDKLDSLAGKLLDPAARLAAREAAARVAEWLERPVADSETDVAKRDGKPKTPGVYRVRGDLRLQPEDRLGPGEHYPLGAEKRALVLIHGTFSNTEAAFAGMRGTREWDELLRYYDGKAIALEHPTLSVNPAVNALELAKQLPTEGRLDLVTHSRGGLVGELLSLAAAGSLNADRFTREAGDIAEEEKTALRDLAQAFVDRKVTIGRFARVGCPARGTLLASPRLDRYANYLFNVLEKIPNVSGWVITVIKSLVLAFLDQRTDPTVIPGLEAQMPESPWIHLINSSVRAGDDHLGAIAGDIQGSHGLAWLIEKASDLFFRQDHDFVVDSLSMIQGAQRPEAFYYFHQGPEATHFQYFSQSDSRRQLRAWLEYDPEEDPQPPAGFKKIDRDAPRLARVARSRAPQDKAPTVIVVPGLMGTSLVSSDSDDDSVLWPSTESITDPQRGIAALKSDDARAGSLLETTYQGLLDRLAIDFRVQVFPYDWRRSLAQSAAELAELLAAELEASEEFGLPVHILAHSTGGLAARLLAAHHDDVWKRFGKRDGRLLLLGCPNLGTYRSLQHATGDSDLVYRLRLLDPSTSVAQVARQMRSFPAIIETLPRDDGAPALWEESWWKEQGIKWAPKDAALHAAGEVLDSLPGDDERTIAVAGVGKLTPAGVDTDAGQRNYIGNDAGDGVVSFATAATGRATYYVAAFHGDLPSLPDAMEGYVDLLRDGRTHRLATTAADAAGVPEIDTTPRSILDPSNRQLFPTVGDLEDAALGRRPTLESGGRDLAVNVEVVHGSIPFADFPVMVGHYAGSTLDGAERYLDRCLGGAPGAKGTVTLLDEDEGGPLTARDLLGLYPGPVGTAIALAPDAHGNPPGAVIIGMGEIGELSPTKLRSGVTRGVLAQAVVALDQWKAERNRPTDQAPGEDREEPTDVLTIGISPVLIGTSGFGRMTIENSIAAMLDGVLAANRLLENKLTKGGEEASSQDSPGEPPTVRIGHVQFIELYEDLAVEAAHALMRVAEKLRDGRRATVQRVLAARHLAHREGGRPGHPGPEYQRGEWRTVVVENLQTVIDSPGRESEPNDEDAKKLVEEKGEVLKSDDASRRTYVLRRGLTFKSIGALARAEEAIHLTQRDLVEKLVAEAVNNPYIDKQNYNTLYELLLPNFLKGQAMSATNLLWVLDSWATHYPWEMLAGRNQEGEIEPLAQQVGMLRRLLSANFRKDVTQATGNRALVVGDPPTGWARLPGARREAKIVRDRLLGANFDVTERIYEHDAKPPREMEVLNALFAGEYRIVHIAAHGHYDPDPERSGVAVGENSFLTPLVFRQLPVVPPLVFLNCCHLAKIDDPAEPEPGESPLAGVFHRFAASVSEQLIRDGVRGVVAAGWAVDDEAAEAFADCFYDRMLRGNPFGQAVREARVEIMERFHGNTWGAYQCYGDPGFRLVPNRRDGGDKKHFVAASELQLRLEQILLDSKTGRTSRDGGEVVKEVEKLFDENPKEWQTGQVLYAAARLLRSVGAFEESIELYERTLSTWQADVPLKAVEKLGNIETRLAAQLADEGSSDQERIRKLLEGAEKRLQQVIAIGATPERHSLLAGLNRKRAELGIGGKTSLSEAAKHYRKAHELALETTGEIDPYSAINWGVFRCLAGAPGGEQDEKVKRELKRLARDSVAAAERKKKSEPTFWNRVTEADAEVMLGLLNGDLDKRVKKIAGMYKKAFELESAEDERRSIRDHVRFLEKMLRKKKDAELAQAAADLLEQLEEGSS